MGRAGEGQAVRRGTGPMALGAVLVTGAVLAACASPPNRHTAAHRPQGTTTTTVPPATGGKGPGTGAPDTGPRTARAVSLVSYGDCSSLLAQLKREALTEVGPYGLQTGGGPVATGMPVRAAAPQNGMEASSGAASPGAAGPSGASSGGAGSGSTAAASPQAAAPYSTTNNQEVGVDEPDLAKTDGRLMVVLRHNPVGLQVVDVSTGRPHLDGFLGLSQLGSPTGLFLDGSEAVVIGGDAVSPQVYEGAAGPAPGAVYPQPETSTSAVVVSLADPQKPEVVRSFSLGGQEVDAGLVGGRVLVVLQGSPQLPFTTPRDSSSAEQQRALQQNRDVVTASTLQQWLPATTTQGGPARQLPACPTVLHPTVASGLGTVSVVSFDPNGAAPGPAVTVVGNASVVYASTDAMYLATSSWNDQMVEGQGGTTGVTTDIHGFSLADPAAPRYLGSGSVPGVLNDQYSLSDYNGVLRVATTLGQAYAPGPKPASGDQQVGPAEGTSDNMVTVLQPSGGALVPVGQISGLGRGERIYGVRFLGSLGYVVTFRQTDPLYVIDLSDPRHPALRGQLQLTGFSAYLHPLGGGRLFGLGQETDQGGDGVQVSVFDVSDPAHPVLDARKYFGSSYSTAEHDPHQFLWWPGRGLAIVPVQQYSGDQNFTGDVVLRVNPDGSLSEVGRISQPQAPPPPPPSPPQPQPAQKAQAGQAAQPAQPAGGTMMAPCCGTGIERALIVGDLIYTVSDGGIMASDIDSLAQVAWLPFTSGQ